MVRSCLVVIAAFASTLVAQGPPLGGPQGMGGPPNPLIREGVQLDLQGKSAEARQSFQKAIDSAENPQTRANAERAMAMSWAFEANCKKAAEYENKVIDYWKTQ